MDILKKLKKSWDKIDYPFLVYSDNRLYFNDIAERKTVDLSNVQSGDVVAIIGDFDPQSILTLLHFDSQKPHPNFVVLRSRNYLDSILPIAVKMVDQQLLLLLDLMQTYQD